MKKEVIIGKTMEEVKEEAVKKFNLPEEELIFNQMNQKSTLFNTKIEVEVIKKEDLNNYIKDFIHNILELIGIESNIEYRVKDGSVWFNVISKESSILIGKGGKNIDALQTIVNQHLHNELNILYRIQIDAGDYKRKKEIRFTKLAKKTAKSVALCGYEIKLDPMNAYDRRIIHNALKDSLDVTTKSQGEEPNRYVVIKPKD